MTFYSGWLRCSLLLALICNPALANEPNPSAGSIDPGLALPAPEATSTATEAAQTFDLGTPELTFQDQDEPELVAPDTASYQFYITDLENRHGPYAPGLSEQLLGLGSVYQGQGLHQEAIKTFKRGIHLARINNGLNSSEQIPLLEHMIRSLVSIGEYSTADERQTYLYRIQRQVYGDRSVEMASAMMRRAAWEWEAYNLQLTDGAFTRLLNMAQLYASVLNNIASREGAYSAKLLEPLIGLLQTQNLIMRYSNPSSGFVAGSASDSLYAEESQFTMLRVSNYKRGQAAIAALKQVYDYNEGEDSLSSISSIIQMGDWHLMHGKRDAAISTYQLAWQTLAAREEASAEQGEASAEEGGTGIEEADASVEEVVETTASWFTEPVMLPDLAGFPRDIPPPSTVKGYAEVSYYISPRGRVRSLELLNWEDITGDEEAREPVYLLRQIKGSLYRPILRDGEPVATETIQKRYAY